MKTALQMSGCWKPHCGQRRRWSPLSSPHMTESEVFQNETLDSKLNRNKQLKHGNEVQGSLEKGKHGKTIRRTQTRTNQSLPLDDFQTRSSDVSSERDLVEMRALGFSRDRDELCSGSGLDGVAEITIQQTNIVKLIFVDSVFNQSIRVLTLRRHEVRALHCCNVTVASSQCVVLDVKVLLVVDFFHFVTVHFIALGTDEFDVSGDTGYERIAA
ncbi:unnamed protein product [Vicia faba]|uniref:Uncharacterized protein n=1 Tax=Vicia faba TaxID=3906 RepID=A0AAV0ZQ31_VICFA|nr:unnamed protein product [Vicia faba]